MHDVANLVIYRADYYFHVDYVVSIGDSVLFKHPIVFGDNVAKHKAISLEDPFHLLNLPVNLLANFKVEVSLREVQTSLVALMLDDAFMRELLIVNYPSSELEESAKKTLMTLFLSSQ